MKLNENSSAVKTKSNQEVLQELEIPAEQWPFPTYKGVPLVKDLKQFKEPEPEEALF